MTRPGKQGQRLFRLLPALVAALTLSACQTTEQYMLDSVAFVPPDQALIRYDGPKLMGATQSHQRYSDMWQVEEVATFKTNSNSLTVWYGAAHSDQPVAIEVSFNISEFAGFWFDGMETDLAAAALENVKTTGRVYLIKAFQKAGSPTQCFTFGSEFDGPSDDRRFRAGAAVYGVYCENRAQAFKRQDFLQVLSGLNTPNRQPETPAWRHGGTPEALTQARAKLAGFPFTFGHAFALGDGNDFN